MDFAPGSVFEGFARVIVGYLWFGVLKGSIASVHDDQGVRPWQSGFDGFYGVNAGRAAIDASVVAVGLFGVGKKGGLWAIFSAVL